MIESRRPSVVDAALGLMKAIEKIERESSDSSPPPCWACKGKGFLFPSYLDHRIICPECDKTKTPNTRIAGTGGANAIKANVKLTHAKNER